jgi:PucR family transcriptional regulator, purine catabolism regulatory protein
MSVSVRWLLQQRDLRLRLRAGSAAATGAATIRFPHATELLDPQPWLSGGELVLSTGLALRDAGADIIAEYVVTLADSDIAALAFGIGLSHPAIPEALLAAAEDRGLVVLEVPYATPFAAITKAVMDRLAEQQYSAIRRTADTQSRITRAALKGGAAAIVRELSTATHTTVAWISSDGSSDIVCPPDDSDIATAARALNPHAAAGTVSITTDQPGQHLTVHPLLFTGRDHGLLAVESTRPLETVEHVLIGHAASLLTLDMEKPIRLRATHSQIGSLALQLLLDGATDDTALLTNAADIDGRIRILAYEQRYHQSLDPVIDAALLDAGRPFFVAATANHRVVVLGGGSDAATVSSWFGALDAEVRTTAGIGLSRAHPLDRLHEAVREAQTAAVTFDRRHAVTEFDPTAGTVVLTNPAAVEALRTIADSTIALLMEHDARDGTALAETLRAFLEANGQWESAATALGVHRHTVRARLSRIDDILGCNLSDPYVRAELLLAARAFDSCPITRTE